jgi:hypothetical protein
MGKFFNAHDLILITAVVVITHFLMQPVYKAIDNATGN